jgi:hypothetical protein
MVAVVIGYALLGFGTLCTVGNWELTVRWLRTRKSGSMIPLGGPLVLAGCALVPAIGWRIGLGAFALDPMMACLIAWPGYLVWRWFRDRPRG